MSVSSCRLMVLFLLYVLLYLLRLSALQFSFFFFLMIRRPPRSTLDRSSAASDVYKRQGLPYLETIRQIRHDKGHENTLFVHLTLLPYLKSSKEPVSYTHLRAHETVLDLVCRLLLEKKNKNIIIQTLIHTHQINIQIQ